MSKAVSTDSVVSVELKLYQYLDYCWKHGGRVDTRKLNDEQKHIVNTLIEKQHMTRGSNNMCYPTRKFYTFVQNLLWDNYVNHTND